MNERFLWQILSHHQYIHQDPLHLLKPPLFLHNPLCQSAAAHGHTMQTVDHEVCNDSMCGLLSQTHGQLPRRGILDQKLHISLVTLTVAEH